MSLTEDRDLESVSAEIPVEDVDGYPYAFVRYFGRRIPFGDDDAAKRISRLKRHESQRVERRVPKILIDAERDLSARARDRRTRVDVAGVGPARGKKECTNKNRWNSHRIAQFLLTTTERTCPPSLYSVCLF